MGLAITELSKVWNPLVSWTNFVWENGGSFIYKNSVSFVAGISHISRNKREALQSYMLSSIMRIYKGVFSKPSGEYIVAQFFNVLLLCKVAGR